MCVLTEKEHDKKIEKVETKMPAVQHLQEKNGS